MQLEQFGGLDKSSVEKLLLYIPCFRQVQAYDESQFQLLLATARVSSVAANQTFIGHGNQDQRLFFLLRGQLIARVKGQGDCITLDNIHAGEMFGELALLLNQPRSADIVVADQSRQAVIFTLECDALQYSEQFTLIDRTTKLIFYRNLVHHLRWKLEKLRHQFPAHPLADKHRRLKALSLYQNDAKQLFETYEQAKKLAALLSDWNRLSIHSQAVDRRKSIDIVADL